MLKLIGDGTFPIFTAEDRAFVQSPPVAPLLISLSRRLVSTCARQPAVPVVGFLGDQSADLSLPIAKIAVQDLDDRS